MQLDKFNTDIPENFFLLMTGKNRGFYARVITDILGALDNSETFNIERAEVKSIIQQNILICNPQEEDDKPGSLSDGEETPAGAVTTTHGTPVTRDYAYMRIKKCGWIVEEAQDDSKECAVSLTSLARLQIGFLLNFSTSDEVYIGNFRNTLMEKFKALLDRSCTRPYMDAFQPILQCCEGINAAQTRIHDNIHRKNKEILQLMDRDKAIQAIHDDLDDLNGGEAQKLLISEGLLPDVQYRVAQCITRIRNDEEMLSWIAGDLAKAKSYLSLEDAMVEVDSGLRKVEICLCVNFNKKVNELGGIKSLYLANIMSRVQLLTEDSAAFANTLTRFLGKIAAMDDKEFESLAKHDPVFRKAIASPGIGTDTSNGKYVPKARDDGPAYGVDPIIDEIPPESDVKKFRARRGYRYTNELVKRILDGRQSMSCTEFTVTTREDMNDLVAVILNSRNSESSYLIEFAEPQIAASESEYDFGCPGPEYVFDGYSVPQFVIREKERRDVRRAS